MRLARIVGPIRRGLPRLVTVLGVLAICLGATSGSCAFFSDTSIDDDAEASFLVVLELQDFNGVVTDIFDRGEPITLVMTVRNLLDTDATVQFPTTRQFDFVVLRDSSDTLVWQLSEDEGPFTPTPTELQFAPGETLTFSRTWNQTNRAGAPLGAGTFEARGVMVFRGFDSDLRQDNQMASAFEPFTIR